MPRVGTGGISIFAATVAAETFFAAVFLAGAFLTEARFAAAFLTGRFEDALADLRAAFFAGFFAAGRFAPDFFAAFFAGRFALAFFAATTDSLQTREISWPKPTCANLVLWYSSADKRGYFRSDLTKRSATMANLIFRLGA